MAVADKDAVTDTFLFLGRGETIASEVVVKGHYSPTGRIEPLPRARVNPNDLVRELYIHTCHDTLVAMTAPTPEQLETALALLAEGEKLAAAKAAETVATAEQPLRHANSIWATETCGEESGIHHLKHKGKPLQAEGWNDDAELALDGYILRPSTGIMREVAQ